MIKRLLKDMLLPFKRAPLCTGLNIFGMSVGIALFLLIMMYVRAELRVNRDYPNYSETYRISCDKYKTGWQGVMGNLGEILSDGLPEVTSFLRFDDPGRNFFIKVNDEPRNIGKLIYADSSLFRFFPMSFIYGDRFSCLDEVFSMVITESTSKRLFGDINPVGQQFLFNNKHFIRITGVIRDPGHETHLIGDAFLSFHSMPVITNRPDIFDSYTSYNYNTYLLIDKAADPVKVENKINEYLDDYGIRNNIESLESNYFFLTEMFDVYFGTEERPIFRKGNISQLRILEAIALLILAMALINYVNLATAQGGSRIHELALRKSIGATRGILMRSIVFEAVFTAIISLNLGIVMLEIIKPFFNDILDMNLTIGYLKHPDIFLQFLLGGIILGLIAGFYPALHITRFDIGRSLQNIITKTVSGSGVRKVLTVIQLVMSIVLLICTGVIYSQLKYTQEIDLGFDKNVLIYTALNSEIKSQSQSFRQELLVYPGIEEVSYSFGSYRLSSERWGLNYLGNRILIHIEVVDEYYLKTLGLELIEGRNFYGPQDSSKILINETARDKYFGNNPIGVKIESMREGKEIVGVVKDFSFQSLHKAVEPLAILYKPGWSNLCNIRMSGSNLSGTLRHLENTWKEMAPNYPFEFHFVNELYEQKYYKERKIGQLFFFFSISSVLIAFLGIFGLITFSVQKRSKEVGIRKVNGATIKEIVWMLSSDISKTVLWAIVPAFTIAAYLMINWLSNFAYHISIPLLIFPAAALIVWLIAMLATIGRSIKTARINPAIVLRSI